MMPFIKLYRYPDDAALFFETRDLKEVRNLFFISTILIPE